MFTGGGDLGKAAAAAVVASLLTFGGLAYSPVMAAGSDSIVHSSNDNGGIAIGEDSVPGRDAGKNDKDASQDKAGYDATGKQHARSDTDYATWVSTDAAVSVGGAKREATYEVKDNQGNTKKVTKEITSTRQITNLAAGSEDTDAVNVAQLKASAENLSTTINSTINKKVAVIFDDKGSLKSTDAKISHQIFQDGVRFPEGEGQSIALGKGAHAYMQGGWKPYYVLFGMKKAAGAIAIGEGSQALSQSIAIGNRTYTGDIGDVNISNYSNFYGDGGAGSGVGSVLLGTNSYTGGTLSTLIGDYSIMSTAYPNAYDKHYGSYTQNAGAVSIGALNSIESATSDNSDSGIANSIVGLANKTNNANGALIYGAGNTITNSFADVATPGYANSAAEAAQSFRESVQNNPGGAALAIGGGNTIDHSIRSQVIGVNNKLTGNLYAKSFDPEYSTQYNMIDGYNNQVANVNHAYVIGANNIIQGKKFSDATKNGVLSKEDRDKAKKDDNLILIGDNHTLANDVANNIILGTADEILTTSVSDIVMMGHNADVQTNNGVAIGSGAIVKKEAGVGGVAIGSDSIANVGAGQKGYYVKHDQRLEEVQGYPFQKNDSAWISRAGAVSVGDTTNEDQSKWITRQITGVAAGTNDTDAVNVAQLKNSQTRFYSIYDPGDNHLGIFTQIPNWEKYKNENNQGAQGYWSMAAGFGTSTGGIASTVIGSMSKIDNKWTDGGPNGTQGATAVSVGTLNFNLSDQVTDEEVNSDDPRVIFQSKENSGVANSIVGQGNLTKNSNGALIYGAGNIVTDSYRRVVANGDNDLESLTNQDMESLLSNPEKAIKTLGKIVDISGGKVMVMGGGNVVDKAYDSQVMGVGNTVVGDAIKFDYKESPEVSNLPENTADEQFLKEASRDADVWTQYMGSIRKQGTLLNLVDGYYSTLKNGQNDYLIGTANEVTGDPSKNKSNIVFGDYHKLNNGNNNIIIGSADGAVVEKAKGYHEDYESGIITSQEITGQKQHTENLEDAVMIGHNADVQKNGGVALGADSVASVDKDVVGYDPSGIDHSEDTTGVWKSTRAAASVGDASKNITRQITNVAAGKELTDAVNVAQLKSAQIHYYSVKVTQEGAEGDKSNYNNDGATGEGSIAIGPFASAEGSHSLALGYSAKTPHSAVKPLADEDGYDDNTAVGYNSQAGYRSTALGYRSQATGGRAVALGTDALADTDNSTAVGMNAQATGKQATALGSLAKASGESATAVGEGANALADYSSAVGLGALVDTGASKGTALGYQAKVLNGAENSMALGAGSQVNKSDSIAIGTGATVTSGRSIAIGKGATVSLVRSIALGDGSIASTAPTDVSSITIPNLNRTYTVSGNWPVGIVSVGSPTAQRTITNVAAGRVTRDSTDAVNGSELYAVATEAAKHATVKAAANSRITVNNTGENQGLGIEYTIGLNTDGLAALTDGLKFAGDDGKSDPGKVISRKLNEQLNIIGGATDTVDAANIGVVKKDDNTLNIRLAKNITGLTSLQATTITSGKVTVNGTDNVITGLSNTTWDKTKDYSQSTKAATEAQIQQAMTQAVADANDTHITAGDYAVGTITDKDGQSVQGVSIDVVDKTGTVGTVRITDVAKASDVGDVTNLDGDIKNADGKTTVVDAVNKVNDKVGNLNYSSTKYVTKGESVTTSIGKLDEAIKNASEAAGKHTIVSTTDSNLSVENVAPKGEAANYQISLKKNLNVDSVTAANKITTKDLKVTGSATIGKVTINADDKGTIGGLTNKTWDAKNITSGQAATEDQLQAATKNAVNYDGDDSKTVTLREDTTIKNVANTTIEEGSKSAVNAGTVYKETRVEKDGIFIRQANTAGENITALDHQVAANTESIYHINNHVSDLDNRVNKVGAGAAALAALHPLDFDPDDKWDFAVGYGNYRNANSVAFGAFYRPNEDTMFSLGTNFGNGENMFNAGLSFKIGQGGSGIMTSKTAMAKTISSLKDTVHKQDQKIEGLENVVDTQDKKIAELEALVKEQGEMIRQYVGKK